MLDCVTIVRCLEDQERARVARSRCVCKATATTAGATEAWAAAASFAAAAAAYSATTLSASADEAWTPSGWTMIQEATRLFVLSITRSSCGQLDERAMGRRRVSTRVCACVQRAPIGAPRCAAH